MNYVVVDLEWNQAMSSKSSVFNKLPIRLGGEIIEIGAVKLTEDMKPGEEFTVDVKPIYFLFILLKEWALPCLLKTRDRENPLNLCSYKVYWSSAVYFSTIFRSMIYYDYGAKLEWK